MVSSLSVIIAIITIIIIIAMIAISIGIIIAIIDIIISTIIIMCPSPGQRAATLLVDLAVVPRPGEEGEIGSGHAPPAPQ